MMKSIGFLAIISICVASFSSDAIARDYCGPEGKGIISRFVSRIAQEHPRIGNVEVQFWVACDRHDTCYGDAVDMIVGKYGTNPSIKTKLKRLPEIERIRKRCDESFRSDLSQICRHQLGESKQLLRKCMRSTGKFYSAVRVFGWNAFRRALKGK